MENPKGNANLGSRNQLGTNKIVITQVSEVTGMPLTPEKAVEGYSNNLGCILREMVSINETNLRIATQCATARTTHKKAAHAVPVPG